MSTFCEFNLPQCGHHSNFTVTRLVNQLPTIICESCFLKVIDSDRRARRMSVPEELQQCFLCFEEKMCRFNVDLSDSADMNVYTCDSCTVQQRQELDRWEEGRVIPTDIRPDEVSPGVFIGAKESAFNRTTLRELGISRVLICCDSLPAYHKDDPTLQYHRLPLADSLAQSLMSYLPSARAFISEGLERGEHCLVHCNAGVSRSGIVVVDWLMQSHPELTRDLDAALAAAKAKRPRIHPNSNFISQIRAGVCTF